MQWNLSKYSLRRFMCSFSVVVQLESVISTLSLLSIIFGIALCALKLFSVTVKPEPETLSGRNIPSSAGGTPEAGPGPVLSWCPLLGRALHVHVHMLKVGVQCRFTITCANTSRADHRERTLQLPNQQPGKRASAAAWPLREPHPPSEETSRCRG